MTTKGRSWYRGQYDPDTGNIIGNDGFSAPPPSYIHAARLRLSAHEAMYARLVRDMHGEDLIRVTECDDGLFEIETASRIAKFRPANMLQIEALRQMEQTFRLHAEVVQS